MAIVNYKTDYPLCILINNKEINKDYFVDEDFTVSRILYLDKSAPKFNNLDLGIISVGKFYPFPKPGKFFRCFISGSSGSGKTTLMCNLLNILNYYNNKMFVLFISSILNDDKLDKQLKKIFKRQCLKVNQESLIKDVNHEIPITLNELFEFLNKFGFESC